MMLSYRFAQLKQFNFFQTSHCIFQTLPMDQGKTAREEGRFVFECAWEVANKVGGIYTVLRSKAQVSTEELGDQYCMFGPMKDDRWRLEVEQIEPENRTIRAAMKKFHKDGFRVCCCPCLSYSLFTVYLWSLANRRLSESYFV